jgi:hypothetical protein
MIPAPVRLYRLYSYVEYSCPVKIDGNPAPGSPACLLTSRPHAGLSCCCPLELIPPSSTLHSLSKRPSPTTLHFPQLRTLVDTHSESGHHLCLTHSHDPQGQTVPGPRACGCQCPDMEGEDRLGGHTLTRETPRIRVSLALVRQQASTRRKVAHGLEMQMSPHLPKTGTDVSPLPRSSSGILALGS